MAQRNYTDIIAGGLIIAFGVATAIYAQRYSMGNATRMGPGYFPTVLGWLLAVLGLLVLLPALRRQGEGRWPEVHWRPLFAILAGIGAFGLTVREFGIVPATFLLVGIAVFAQHRVRLGHTLALCAGISVLGVLVFIQGLGVILPIFNWPF